MFNTDSAGAGGSQGWIMSAQYEPIDVSYLKAWAETSSQKKCVQTTPLQRSLIGLRRSSGLTCPPTIRMRLTPASLALS